MTANEAAAKAVADSVARVKQADEDATLAAEAFAFGVFEKYLAAKVDDINRRINERYGTSGNTVGGNAPAPQPG